MIHCPVCTLPLLPNLRSEVEVDFCPAHGIWLDHGELLRVSEHERHALGEFVWEDLFRSAESPPRDDARSLACPSCSGPLAREQYEGVQVDWCAKHGVWLDNGELEAILNNLRLDASFLRGVTIRFAAARF